MQIKSNSHDLSQKSPHRTRSSAGQNQTPDLHKRSYPDGFLNLQQFIGNQAVAKLMRRQRIQKDRPISSTLTRGQIPALQREGEAGGDRYVSYEIIPRARVSTERFSAELHAAISPDQRTGIALRMVQVLPAVAAILDENLSVQNRTEILDRSSSVNPGAYGELGLSTNDASALWDFYKARWESPDLRTRRTWLRVAQRRISQLLLPWAVRRYISDSFRSRIGNRINRLIRQRIAALRGDRNFAVLSQEGVPLEEPIIVTAASARTERRGSSRWRGSRETLMTPQETGELYEIDDPGSPVTAEEIEAARAEIRIQVVRSREEEFINTDILAPMPVAPGSERNIRNEAFEELIRLLRQQAELEADIETREQRASSAAQSQSAGETPPATDPELSSLNQSLVTVREQIQSQSTVAKDVALRWYREREAEIGADVEPTEPRARRRRRLARASTARGSEGVRLYYIRQAIAALEAGRMLRRYRRVHYRGHVAGRRVDLRPTRLGHKVDRPEGHVGGGPGYHEGLLEQRVQAQTGLTDEYRPMTLHVLRAFRRLEGPPQSLNTWDSAVLTLGSGIAARGRLQRALWEFKVANPQGFRALFGRFGIDVYETRGVYGISVQVPSQPVSEQYQPGQQLFGERAIEYIVNDPVLMVQLRRAGHAGAWQSFLIDDAIESVREALEYQYNSVAWGDLVQGLPGPLVEGTYFALANNIHGSGGTGRVTRALNRTWRQIHRDTEMELEQLIGNESALVHRQRLAVAAVRAAPRNRRRAFIAVVPELSTHLP